MFQKSALILFKNNIATVPDNYNCQEPSGYTYREQIPASYNRQQ